MFPKGMEIHPQRQAGRPDCGQQQLRSSNPVEFTPCLPPNCVRSLGWTAQSPRMPLPFGCQLQVSGCTCINWGSPNTGLISGARRIQGDTCYYRLSEKRYREWVMGKGHERWHALSEGTALHSVFGPL